MSKLDKQGLDTLIDEINKSVNTKINAKINLDDLVSKTEIDSLKDIVQINKEDLDKEIVDLKQHGSNVKEGFATVITSKGVTTVSCDTFETMINKVGSIKTKLPILEGDVGVIEDNEGNVYGVSKYKNTQLYKSVNNRYTKTWEYAVSSPLDVYIDSEGYVYICSDKVYKVSPLAELVWSYDIKTSVAVKVDIEGYVYICGNNKITKLNSEGGFLWDYTLYNITSVEVDSEGYVYICGGTWSSSGRVSKVSSNGIKVWEYALPSSVNSLALDRKGNVYLFGVRKSGNSADGDIIKFSNEGTLLWKYGFYYAEDLTVDSECNVYFTGSPSSSTKATLKVNTDGELVWSNSVYGNGLSIDKFDNLYISESKKVSKKSKDMGLIWEFDETLDNYDFVANSNGLCCLASRASSNGKIIVLEDNYIIEKIAVLNEREVNK